MVDGRLWIVDCGLGWFYIWRNICIFMRNVVVQNMRASRGRRIQVAGRRNALLAKRVFG